MSESAAPIGDAQAGSIPVSEVDNGPYPFVEKRWWRIFSRGLVLGFVALLVFAALSGLAAGFTAKDNAWIGPLSFLPALLLPALSMPKQQRDKWKKTLGGCTESENFWNIRPEPNIRRSSKKLLRVQRRAYRTEAQLVGNDGSPLLHESLEELRDPPLTWTVARGKHTIVGAIAWTETTRELAIDRLFVEEDAADGGVDRRLLQTAINAAGQRPVTVTTASANSRVRTLYSSLGFVPASERLLPDGLRVVSLRLVPLGLVSLSRVGPAS